MAVAGGAVTFGVAAEVAAGVAAGVGSGVASEEKGPDATATEQQLTSIRKLCQSLGRPEPENQEALTYATARELIQQLSLEYRQSRKAS